MGCGKSKLKNIEDPKYEAESIDKIFDYLTSDSDLTEACVIALSEQMKRIVLQELFMSMNMIKEKQARYRKSNAIDLFLVATTDDSGNITYGRFRKHLRSQRLRPEHYQDLRERLKKIRLHKGKIGNLCKKETKKVDCNYISKSTDQEPTCPPEQSMSTVTGI